MPHIERLRLEAELAIEAANAELIDDIVSLIGKSLASGEVSAAASGIGYLELRKKQGLELPKRTITDIVNNKNSSRSTKRSSKISSLIKRLSELVETGYSKGNSVKSGVIDKKPNDMVNPYRLSNVYDLLKNRLPGESWSVNEVAHIADSLMRAFQASAASPTPETVEAAVDYAVATARSLRHQRAIQGAAGSAPEVALPYRAPEVWAERDTSKGETPIEFLRRVWGPYMDAGILYQDDIKRLGDARLVRAIRTYCQRHPEFKAADVLPPPRQVRTDRAFAAAAPGSAEAEVLRSRIRMRKVNREARQRARPAP